MSLILLISLILSSSSSSSLSHCHLIVVIVIVIILDIFRHEPCKGSLLALSNIVVHLDGQHPVTSSFSPPAFTVVVALDVGTLKDGYVRKVPLPRVPRIQCTDTCYSEDPWHRM